jgi:hypothetical protein
MTIFPQPRSLTESIANHVPNTTKLNAQQEACIELLATGQTKTAAAAAIGVAARTVFRWCHNAGFVAALNERRHDLQEANTERMRSLVCRALAVYEEALGSPDLAIRFKAAEQILRYAGIIALPPVKGSTDPRDIAFQWAHEYVQKRERFEDLADLENMRRDSRLLREYRRQDRSAHVTPSYDTDNHDNP